MWNRSSGRQAARPRPGGAATSETAAPADVDLSRSRRLEAALDGIAAAIVVCDGEGRRVFRNEAAARLLSNRPGDALVGQAVTEAIRAALAGARPERRLDLISPLRRSFSIRAFPIGEGAVDGAVVVVEDTTELQRLEAVRRDFVANVSHELKTPTGAITLLAETLDGETDPQVVSRLVRRMGGEAERLSNIIDDLLDLSRIESHESPVPALVPVIDIVQEAAASLQAVAAGLEVEIDVHDIPARVAVSGDRRDLVSAVTNLIDNGIKYSEAGGVVTVAATTVADRVEVSVADRGVGIPQRDLERVFERFYRVDRARSRATGGTGLGLSIVRHVAANHGGSVRVTSVEGEGSTFVLDLPAVAVGPAPRTARTRATGDRPDDHD
jgi:two-component system sensor histidine kinase SenX3